jgi:Ion channel
LHILAIIAGALLIAFIAQDGFETIVLPRRVSRRFRLASMFYTYVWMAWSALAHKMRPGNRREQYLGFFGPLSLILLLAIWASMFVLGFALLQWGLQSPLHAPEKVLTFGSYIYLSGTTFFTLGLGDVTPVAGLARVLTVLEGGLGFAFLALIIGYVPVLYQAFSRREVKITLLDARAGSPPTAAELLRRHSHANYPDELVNFLREWESWCAELLESHLSYHVLTYYRSQHERQSWLAALTVVLDTCALIMVGVDGIPVKPAKFTFAIARHAAVDLAQTYGVTPVDKKSRLSSADYALLKDNLAEVGITVKDGPLAEKRLTEIRAMYEPFLNSLSDHLFMPLPTWIAIGEHIDDWQTSAWDHILTSTPQMLDHTMHFE